jgi:nucleotide-binding universal stress UspA family protein
MGSSPSCESVLAAAAAQAADQGVNAVTHPPDGDPADALLALAERNDAAIIVVGSRGMHTGEREWFGNIPDKISHKGIASVLIVLAGEAGSGDAIGEVAAPDVG